MKEYKIGRLADKPEIKRVESSKGAFNVVNITLYIDDLGAKKDENGHRPGVPVRLTAWDEQALQLAKHDKGELVGIMGYTNLNEFESKNGQTIKQYGITVSSVFNAQTAIDISKKLNSFYKEIEETVEHEQKNVEAVEETIETVHEPEMTAPESLESFEGFEELDSFEDFDYDLDEVL